MKKLPKLEHLLTHFTYRKGIILWKKVNSNRCKIGDVAGSKNSLGYLVVRLNNQDYLVHRIVWKINTGSDPFPFQIDHINMNRSDNRIENLRLATNQQNNRNRRKSRRNTSGRGGVCRTKTGGFTVDFCGKYIGSCKTFEEAVKLRERTEKEFGFTYHDS